MNPTYDLTGSQVRQAREYPIAVNTVIQSGQAVVITNGLVVAASATQAAPILGIAAESHLGVADAFNNRSNGKTIKIYDSPTQIYTCRAPEYAASAGTVNTLTCAAKSDTLKGGLVKLVDKESTSTNTDPLGTVYNIILSNTSGVITTDRMSTTPIATGDIFEIYPPVGYNQCKLTSGQSGISLDAVCDGSPVTVAGRVISLGLVEIAVKNIYS